MRFGFRIFVYSCLGILALFPMGSAASSLKSSSLNSSLIFNSGRSLSQNTCSSPWFLTLSNGGTCSEKDSVFRAAYHYQFTPILGFEVSYGNLGDAAGEGVRASTQTNAYWKMKTTAWAWGLTATVPIGAGFEVLGKLGRVQTKFVESIESTTTTGQPITGVSLNGVPITDSTLNSTIYGVGAQFNFSREFALRIQYENYGKYDVYGAYGLSRPNVTLSATTVGIVLRF